MEFVKLFFMEMLANYTYHEISGDIKRHSATVFKNYVILWEATENFGGKKQTNKQAIPEQNP